MQIDFEALFARSPNPYVVLDPELRMVWMNDAYLRVTMRSRADIVGRKMLEAFPSDPDSESHILLTGSLERVLASGEADEIALIRYDILNRDGSLDVRYWSATHTPLFADDGSVAYILQHTVDVTELQTLRALRDEMGVVQRAEAVQARNLDLAAESRQLRSLFEQAPGFIAILSGPEHRFRLANEAYRRLVGGREVVGHTVAEALPEVVDQGFLTLLDQVRTSGTPYIGRREKVMLEGDTPGRAEERFLDFIYQPIFTDGGQVSGVFVQGHDVTEQVEAEERLKWLINELSHRMKNTLAVVQGLAAQSFRMVDGADEARRIFDARLNALAAAHSLLTPQNWEAASLEETVVRSVEATAGADVARFRFEGPDVTLDSQAALALAMVVHELSTNAIKYGALSVPGGEVEIRWSVERGSGGHWLTIAWSEHGGPVVEEPSRRGFGTRLIERGMATGRDSKVEMTFAPDGLRCIIATRLQTSGAKPASSNEPL